MPLKLISANIQGSYHFQQRVLPFLDREQPSIVCLQEVFEEDLPTLAERFGKHLHYVPMTLVAEPNPHLEPRGRLGLAIGVRGAGISDITFHSQHYVQWPGEEVPSFFNDGNPNSMNRLLLWVRFRFQDQEYCIATTHFTWSKDAAFTAEQARDFSKLTAILDTLPPHVVCGDFNSPRQGEPDNVYHQLESRYQSWVPAATTSTLDEVLHKVGHLNLTVDGLFSSAEYQIEAVTVVAGVSDHKALVGSVTKVPAV